MKESKVTFGKVFWPSLIAALIVSLMGLLIWLMILGGLIGGFEIDTSLLVRKNTVLHMQLSGPIGERSSSNFDPMNFEMNETAGLASLLHGFEEAKNDTKIKGIYIELNGVDCGFSTALELRNAINDFEASGKFVVAYNSGEAVYLKDYYIASAANENYGFPVSNFVFTGIGAELSFFKNAMEKLDIEMQVIRGSDNHFKSAVEPFFREDMSDSSRMQLERYMHGIWKDVREDIAKDRKLSSETLDSLANNLSVLTVEDAVKHGLIDATKYEDEVIDLIKEKTGTKSGKELELLSFAKYAKKKFIRNQAIVWENSPNVAVILAEGSVARTGNGLTSEDICQLFRDVRKTESIKTVVFRINSPGGSALASDEIWREVELTNKTKKVIVSMGDVAASGGYYFAAPAEAIFADPTTVTGSIGVFGVIPYTGDMFENKLGITFDRAKTNEHSILTTNQRPTEEELRILQDMIDEIYGQFRQVVADGRGMSTEEVQRIARGRIWTGRDAKKVGLVDELGGLLDAIDYAVEKAGINKPEIAYYPQVKEDKFAVLLEQLAKAENMDASTSSFELPDKLVKYYEQLRSLENVQGIQMRMPYFLELY